MSSLIFVVIMGHWAMETNAAYLGFPMLDGPNVALVGEIVDFGCEVKTFPEELILLQLYKEGDRSKFLGEYTSIKGEKATFMVVVRASYEGFLECVASVQNNSRIQPTVSYRHHLRVVEPVRGAKLVVQSGPVEFYEGRTLSLRCNVTSGNHLSYSWLFNGQHVLQSPFRFPVHEQLLVYRTTPRDSGSYACVAANQFNETEVYTAHSPEVLITVKELVSDADISFTVVKRSFQNYSALVTCRSTRGTLPITFSLYNRTDFVTNKTVDDWNATFTIAVELDYHLGWLQCQAENGDRITHSRWMALEVVSVGGPGTIHFDYDIGEDFCVVGLRLFCQVAKGSHPRYQWFLNGSLLESRGTFYWAVHQPPQPPALLLSVGRSSAGTYHCEVSDSFDNTTSIKSEDLYLDMEVLNRLPLLVVVVVFGCFLFLVTLVSICCCVGVMFRRRQFGDKPLRSLEMHSMILAYEDEFDLEEFREDSDVLRTATMNDSDLASIASTDEWPETDEVKNTLEDEPVP